MTLRSARTAVWMRTLLSIAGGIVVGAFVVPLLGGVAGILSGWAAFALVNVLWVLLLIWPMDAAATREHATLEAPGRRVARLISTLGSVVSLAAVLVVSIQAQQMQGVDRYALAGVAVVSVAASWALIQVEYVLRYARMYHAEPDGGIDFNQKEAPEYTDFVYFSINLGMTYQVSDTNVEANAIRRMVIAHTVLSYLFGTVILASIINLVVGLG
ncbi:MAG: DUF1345 domain-containing protein [Microbacterium sp.]|uniref:Membrane protein n=1 Tax=Microbacterium natoriense TaxID=284570 RepID=A0AAW8EVU5_9MICO|nr:MULTISPECIES: DUF1345 domain-containing protein [Microbacterium]MBW8762557.1 DUF1345 domain-containing protein [Microbacterium sp.]MDQ0647651.1 putative membrane protein [Microbacterium natoriense]